LAAFHKLPGNRVVLLKSQFALFFSRPDLPDETIWLGIYVCTGKQQKRPRLSGLGSGMNPCF